MKEVVLSLFNKYVSKNPFTGQLIQEFSNWSHQRIHESIQLSRKAYLNWRDTDIEQRKKFLSTLAAYLRMKVDDWAVVITSEMGKPLGQSKAEILKSARLCDYYYQHLERLSADRIIPMDGNRSGIVKVQPQGAVLGVMPWNFPVW